MRLRNLVACAAVCLLASPAICSAADSWGLEEGSPDIKSAGVLAFAPEGILLVGDLKGAAVFAIDTGDKAGDPAKREVNMEDVNQKVAELLGASSQGAEINDLAVNPESGNIYLSATAGSGDPALVKIDGEGNLSKVNLKKARFAKAELADAPEDKVTGEGRRRGNRRDEAITDLAYHEGKVMISGLSDSDAPSTIREIAFPFAESNRGTSLEIYHGAHGRVEDDSPARVFVPFTIDGEPNLLAGFTCTPLVKFPVKQLEPGKKVRGTTLAELGNRNRPLDMIVYQQDGKDYLLLANSSRGVMKVSTEEIEREEGITERISGGGTAGQPYETIEDLQGVVQLDKLNDEQAVVLVQTDSGSLNLKTIALP